MRVKIIGASSPFLVERLAAGVEIVRSRGFVVDDSEALQGTHAYLNGDDATRTRLLEAAFDDASVDVIWLARGGYGLTRIVPRLRVPRRIPVVVGFSDATALFARLHKEGLADRCVHAPLATSITGEAADSVAHAVDVVRGGAGQALPPLRVHVGASVDVAGPLFAGNLCVLAALCGTPLLPDLRGHVVVIEEVGERPYRIDRMLTQLIDAGAFAGVAAVVVGHLTQCDEPKSQSQLRDPAPSGLDVVIERLSSLGVPLLSGLPVGHEAPNFALPLGRSAHVVVDGGVGRLMLRPA